MQPIHALRSQRVLTSSGIGPAVILIRGSKIDDVLLDGEPPDGATLIDCGHDVIMPGLVDSHVHINEPGRTHWEGFDSATMSAAAGGITTVVDMPLNSTPVTTTPKALEAKFVASEGKRWVHCGFYGGVIPEHATELQEMSTTPVLGMKAFMVDSGIQDFPPVAEKDLEAAMRTWATSGRPLLVHAELASGSIVRLDDVRNYAHYLASRPQQWEKDAIALLIKLCRLTGCHVHIVHLSSAEALPMIRDAKEEGLPLTVETCPHYLYFCSEDIPDGDTRFKCAPPIRERANNRKLWEAVLDGTIDFIVSDHSPCEPELKHLKEGNLDRAWGGIASLQLGLSIIWTMASDRGVELASMTEWMSHGPATLVGLDDSKGRIAAGFDADLTVWAPEEAFTVRAEDLFHRHKITPYDGLPLKGVVKRTYVDGEEVYREGTILGSPRGRLLEAEQR